MTSSAPDAAEVQEWRWDSFVLRPRSREFFREGIAVKIGSRALDLLIALASRNDRVVSKQELLDAVWQGMVVEDNNLSVQISALRKLLGPAAIATVAGRGYRFTPSFAGMEQKSPGAISTASMPVGGASLRRIFISYRRTDSEHAVGRLADELSKHFTPDQIFHDLDSIEPGTDFIESLQRALEECAAVLVVIGPNWLAATDKHGRRRIDLEDDWVRQEVAASLGARNVRVFPLLLGNIDMPSREELPEPLRPILRRQAFSLTVRHWKEDVAGVVSLLTKIPELA